MRSGVVWLARWAEARPNTMVQSLDPSAMPGCHGVPKPEQWGVESGADNDSPEAVAVTVAVTGPAVAVAVTVAGVSPSAHTQADDGGTRVSQGRVRPDRRGRNVDRVPCRLRQCLTVDLRGWKILPIGNPYSRTTLSVVAGLNVFFLA